MQDDGVGLLERAALGTPVHYLVHLEHACFVDVLIAKKLLDVIEARTPSWQKIKSMGIIMCAMVAAGIKIMISHWLYTLDLPNPVNVLADVTDFVHHNFHMIFSIMGGVLAAALFGNKL